MVIYINHRKVYFIHANTHTCARGIYVTYAVVDKVGDVPIVGCVYSVLIVHIVQVEQVRSSFFVVDVTSPLSFLCCDYLE